MKKTITLRTLEKWIEKQQALPCNDYSSDDWEEGYNDSLSDLSLQVQTWKGSVNKGKEASP